MKIKNLLKTILLIILLNFSITSFAVEDPDEWNYIWLDEAIEEGQTIEIPTIYSRSAVIYDRTSKTVIWGKNENQEVPMASTTKIMTAIVMVEELGEEGLKNQVEVCQEAANMNGSSLGIKTGDKITYYDLLYGLMLPSGNDAAVQIAISISGSVEEFTKLMNIKADELGLKNTHFVTPHGLDREEHYTTAKELAIITDYALSNPIISKVVSTKKYTVTINGYPKTISNSNELLGYLDGVTGVKTGFTNGAGRCLVTSVNRNGFEIITVVLGADTKKIRTKDSIRLIEYTYKNYELRNIEELIQNEYRNWCYLNKKRIYVYKGIKTNPEVILDNIEYKIYPVLKNSNIIVESSVNTEYEAPLEQNTEVGKISVQIDDNMIEEIKIKTKEEIKRKDVKIYFIEFMQLLKQVI